MAWNLVIHGLLLVLIISIVPLVSASVSGLIFAVLQAATSIQEQSLAFLLKLLSLAASLFLVGPWIYSALDSFVVETITSLADVGAP